MKQFRFSFQWFTPDKIPVTCWEFTIFAYNSGNAIDRAKEKVIDSGRDLIDCVITFWEVK